MTKNSFFESPFIQIYAIFSKHITFPHFPPQVITQNYVEILHIYFRAYISTPNQTVTKLDLKVLIYRGNLLNEKDTLFCHIFCSDLSCNDCSLRTYMTTTFQVIAK